MSKDMDFCHLQEVSDKYVKILLDTATKTGLDKSSRK